MTYDSLKILHFLSASLLITSFACSVKLWWKNAPVNAQMKMAFAMIPFALFQLVTGFTMLSLKHDFSTDWIKGIVIGFFLLVMCWGAFIYHLLSEKQNRIFQISMMLVCILAMLGMIFLMANK